MSIPHLLIRRPRDRFPRSDLSRAVRVTHRSRRPTRRSDRSGGPLASARWPCIGRTSPTAGWRAWWRRDARIAAPLHSGRSGRPSGPSAGSYFVVRASGRSARTCGRPQRSREALCPQPTRLPPGPKGPEWARLI